MEFSTKSANLLIERLNLDKFDLIFSLECKGFESNNNNNKDNNKIKNALTYFFSEAFLDAVGSNSTLIITDGTNDDSFSVILNSIRSKIKKRQMTLSILSITDVQSSICNNLNKQSNINFF